MTLTSRKSNWIDSFRGFAMALIFVGHIWNFPSNPKQDMYTYHVAIFFVLAGFLYNAGKYSKISLGEQLKSKAKAYIIPYFVLCFVNLLLSIGLYVAGNGATGLGSKLLTWLGAIFYVYSPGMPNCATLWFLPC
ncbi:MAG: acyltransferase family protein, partial [Bacteroidaceae bacterium]|nr:acyltransferase family protein [Bacteroidaceae bacterium]